VKLKGIFIRTYKEAKNKTTSFYDL